MELETVRKLLKLSRLKISDAEAEGLRKELSSILEYVGMIDKTAADAPPAEPAATETVVREDRVYGEPIASRDELLDASLLRKGDHIEVQAVFEQ